MNINLRVFLPAAVCCLLTMTSAAVPAANAAMAATGEVRAAPATAVASAGTVAYPGQSSQASSIGLAAYGAIAGLVRATGGAGMGGVCVLATSLAGAVGVPPGGVPGGGAGTGGMPGAGAPGGQSAGAGPGRLALTWPGGRYVIAGLAPGGYMIRFSACQRQGSRLARWSGGTTPLAAIRVTVRAGLPTWLRPVTLRPARPAAVPSALASTTGGISGTVTAGPGKTPVAGICVLIEGPGGSGGLAVTGPHGGYAMAGLAPGTYTVGFAGGCGSTGSYAPQYYDRKANQILADPVIVAAGQTTTGIGAAMRPGGTITGTVTNSQGSGLTGICVGVTAPLDPAFTTAFRLILGPLSALLPLPIALGVTTNGRYRIANLPPGNYAIGFYPGCEKSSAGYAAQWFAPQSGARPAWVSIAAGVVTWGINARMRLAGVLSGTVRNGAGKPLAGICPIPVGIDNQPPPLAFLLGSAPKQTGLNGGYRITGLAPGRYDVAYQPCDSQPYAQIWYSGSGSAAAATPVAVRDGRVSAGISQVMTAGQAVSGTITSAGGHPVAGACVFAVDSGWYESAGAITRADGSYRLPHLAAGRYLLMAMPCGSGGSTLASATGPSFLVGQSRPLSGVSKLLPPAGSIAGTVRGGNPAAALSDVCVEATPKTGGGVPALGVGSTGADGSYLVSGLAPGQYLVRFTTTCFDGGAVFDGTAGFAPQWFDGKHNEASATPVQVGGGVTRTGVDATLAADGGMSGTVTVRGVPAAGVCVLAYVTAGQQPAAVAITRGNGSYQIADLPPGGYDVKFTAGCGRAAYAAQWYRGVTSRAAATPVPVTAGAVTAAVNAR